MPDKKTNLARVFWSVKKLAPQETGATETGARLSAADSWVQETHSGKIIT